MKIFIKEQLKKLTDEELQLLIHFDNSFFDYPWINSDWEKIRKTNSELLILDEKKGLCLFQLNPYDKSAHLLKILVMPEYRRQGAAQFFLNKSVEILKSQGYMKIILEVRADNEEAIKFYIKNHFKKLNVVIKYYSDGKDAWRMLKKI